MKCQVFRCARQTELYLYVREGLGTDALPPDLLRRTGRLTEVMTLDLHPERRLARADATAVREQLGTRGWYLQLPPDGRLDAHLHFGD